MGNLSWPLALYDFISILIPGAVFPAALWLVAPKTVEIYRGDLWIVLIAAYVQGHLIQNLSRLFHSGLAKIWPATSFMSKVSPEFRSQVEAAVNRYYGHEFSKSALDKHMRDLCYSPVWNRMDNYKLFTALADLNRALSFISMFVLSESLGIASRLWTGSISSVSALCYAFASLIALALFSDRARFFHRLADLVVYHSFLAYAHDMHK